MKRLIPVVLLLSAILYGCGRNGRVISRSDFVDIYADMLLADEWLDSHPELRHQTDTSAFYEPIFQKYGYTTLDYDASVFKYLRDPENYSKIMVDVGEKLRLELNRLRRLKKKSDAARAINAKIFGYSPKDFEIGDVPKIWENFPISAAKDTTAVSDTLAISDTLSAADSIALADTLSVPETVAPEESMIVKQDKIQEQCTISTNLPTLPIREKQRMKLNE